MDAPADSTPLRMRVALIFYLIGEIRIHIRARSPFVTGISPCNRVPPEPGKPLKHFRNDIIGRLRASDAKFTLSYDRDVDHEEFRLRHAIPLAGGDRSCSRRSSE